MDSQGTTVAIQMLIIMLEFGLRKGVSQHELEYEAFTMSAADSICAERGEQLILELIVVRFTTDFCGISSVQARDFILTTDQLN